jgi:hypothetical protein
VQESSSQQCENYSIILPWSNQLGKHRYAHNRPLPVSNYWDKLERGINYDASRAFIRLRKVQSVSLCGLQICWSEWLPVAMQRNNDGHKSHYKCEKLFGVWFRGFKQSESRKQLRCINHSAAVILLFVLSDIKLLWRETTQCALENDEYSSVLFLWCGDKSVWSSSRKMHQPCHKATFVSEIRIKRNLNGTSLFLCKTKNELINDETSRATWHAESTVAFSNNKVDT